MPRHEKNEAHGARASHAQGARRRQVDLNGMVADGSLFGGRVDQTDGQHAISFLEEALGELEPRGAWA